MDIDQVCTWDSWFLEYGTKLQYSADVLGFLLLWRNTIDTETLMNKNI